MQLGEGGERPATAASVAQQSNSAGPHGHHHGHQHQYHGHPDRNHAPGAQGAAAAGAGGAAAPAAPLSPAAVSSGVVHALINVFLKRHFKYLSLCRGGYAACHALILASDHSLELVDHNQSACLECTGRRKVKEKKTSQQQQHTNTTRSDMSDGCGTVAWSALWSPRP